MNWSGTSSRIPVELQPLSLPHTEGEGPQCERGREQLLQITWETEGLNIEGNSKWIQIFIPSWSWPSWVKKTQTMGGKINGKHTQTCLPTSPNNSDKQTTVSTGKNTVSTGKNKAKQKLQPSSYLVKIKSIKELQGSWNNRVNIQTSA